MDLGPVSFGEFAKLVRTSEPTLRKRLPDAPHGVVLARGRNGESYHIDPTAGVAWWQSIAAEVEAERTARAAALESLQLDLLGPDTALEAHDVAGLTPGEQAAQLDAELKALKLGEHRGELVRAADVEATAAKFMLAVKDKLTTLTDRLRKRAELTSDTAAALDDLVQGDLHDLADTAATTEDHPLAQEEGATAGRAI